MEFPGNVPFPLLLSLGPGRVVDGYLECEVIFCPSRLHVAIWVVNLSVRGSTERIFLINRETCFLSFLRFFGILFASRE